MEKKFTESLVYNQQVISHFDKALNFTGKKPPNSSK